ncbi:hypothetical protein WJX72_010647 [[Myrmecia] bisecta]|uniref:Uncharacterized protein n=1 Tax=[Myrmecia] bisecta TaxID=41462 RepID=A0AAW1PP81_9CHLO
MGVPAREPTSWADDLNSYRDVRGSRSMSPFTSTQPPYRMPRTVLCPLGDTRHPNYPLSETHYKPVKQDGSLERYSRHGWGNVALLKQDGSPLAQPQEQRVIKPRPPSPSVKDGRDGLFGTLQGTEAGPPTIDSWLGNSLIDPKKGRKPARPPPDPKGRKDLFDVLNLRSPTDPSGDSWLGHQLIDPSKGKASAPGPEQRMGRQDLFEIFQQRLLHKAIAAKSNGARGKDGALTDSWIGNMLIDPAKGRRDVDTVNAKSHLFGAHLQADTLERASDWGHESKRIMTEETTPAKRQVVRSLIANEPDPNQEAARLRYHPQGLDNSGEMYNTMQGFPMSDEEAAKVGQIHRKRIIKPIPGEVETQREREATAWRPRDSLKAPSLQTIAVARSAAKDRPWK